MYVDVPVEKIVERIKEVPVYIDKEVIKVVCVCVCVCVCAHTYTSSLSRTHTMHMYIYMTLNQCHTPTLNLTPYINYLTPYITYLTPYINDLTPYITYALPAIPYIAGSREAGVHRQDCRAGGGEDQIRCVPSFFYTNTVAGVFVSLSSELFFKENNF